MQAGNDLTQKSDLLAAIVGTHGRQASDGTVARLRAGARNPLSRRDWQVRPRRFLLSGIIRARLSRKD
jgi:hypothetical protein